MENKMREKRRIIFMEVRKHFKNENQINQYNVDLSLV